MIVSEHVNSLNKLLQHSNKAKQHSASGFFFPHKNHIHSRELKTIRTIGRHTEGASEFHLDKEICPMMNLIPVSEEFCH